MMNERIRHFKAGLISLLIVYALAGCAAATGAARDESYPPGSTIPHTITVTGYGEARAAPDVAYVQLGVNVTDHDPAKAVDENNARSQAVFEALDKLGVGMDAIQTSGYSVWPEDRFDPQTGMPTNERIYHVDNLLYVTVRDLDKAGEIIQAALDAGASTVVNLSFGVEDVNALQAEARQKAIDDARARAEEIATGLGATLGEPLVISEGGGYYPPPYPGAYPTPAYVPYPGGGAVPPIAPGQFSISTSIYVIFTLE